MIACPLPVGAAECWAVDRLGIGTDTTPLGTRYLAAKFKDPALGAPLAELFADVMISDLPAKSVVRAATYIVAVPSRTALADEFAAALAAGLGLSAPPATLRWTRKVSAVKGMRPERRAGYLAGAMEASPVRGTIVLVDDVLRSTATLGEATRALFAAGADRVACAALLMIDADHPG